MSGTMAEALTVTNSTLTNDLAQGGSDGNASSSTAAFVVVGTAIGGAIGEGAFFTAATPGLVVGNSTFTGNQSLGGSDLLYAASNFTFPLQPLVDAGSGRGGALGAVAGNVSLSQSTLTGNTAQGGSLATDVRNGITLIINGSAGLGGGVDDEFDFGVAPPPAATALTIAGTSITSNAALGSGPSGPGFGGGVASAQVNASVSNCIVKDNRATGSFGGGFTGSSSGTFSYTYGGGSATGGGLYSASGALTISSSAVDDNLAQGGPGSATLSGGGAGGGGVNSAAPLVLSNATLAGNQAVGGTSTAPLEIGGGAGGAGGGGLSCGAATITNSVFTDNLAIGGADGAGVGGGAGSGGASTGALDMSNCTFTGNQALGGAGLFGGIAEAGGLGVGSNGPNVEVSNTNFIGNSAIGGSGSIANENTGAATRALGAAYPLSFSRRTRARRPHSPTAISSRTSRSAGRVRTVPMVKVAACS